MAQQSINIGALANDGSGDPLRTAFDKINDNFLELYTVSGAGPGNNLAFSGNSIISEDSSGDITLDPNGTGRIVVATAAELRFTDHTDNAVAHIDTDGDMKFSSSLTFDGTTLAVIGASTISTTLGVTGTTTLGALNAGETTLTSATIGDLTSGRVTVAGTAGAVEDSANLTFNGTTLAVTGAATISTTLGVTGESTLASAIISDLTAGRVALAGTGGAVEDSANLTFDGTTMAVTGAATISTTLGVTGESTLASATISDLTTGRVTFASTAGSLVDNANLTFDGSTLTAGSIIASDITDNRVVVGGTAGLLEDSANLTFNGTTLAVTGTVTVGGQLSFNDNRISTTNSNENIDLDPSGTGTVNFAVPTQTTVGSAGAAANVPAAPTVYLKIRVSGVEYVIPAFAVS